VDSYEKSHNEREYELLPATSERTFPPAPFPRMYVHCVIDDLYNVVQAVHALRAAGSNARDIHVMACWDFVEAVERRQQRQQSRLSKMLKRLLSFFDEGFSDVYLHEALRGHHILMVRLSSNEQLEQVRDILARHDAYLIKYVDTWTVTDLSPAPKHAVRQVLSNGEDL
jgi:hypothetical protein